MMLMICGIISAAPASWTNRAMISVVAVGARAQSSELTVNTINPTR